MVSKPAVNVLLLELHEAVCSFLKLVVLGILAKSQKLGNSHPKRQDSSVYIVAGILVLCKSPAALAVELRGEWEPARGCPALLPLTDTSAGAAPGCPPTQRAACPCSPNLLCHLLLAPVLDHAGFAVHTASVSQGPFGAISRVHSGEIPTCHGKNRKLKLITFHQYSWGIWPLILNRTELNRMHT